MTLYEAVSAAQKLTGQVYDQETMFRWLSEFDGQVAFEVYRAESWTPYTDEDADSVLLVPFPYDKVYVHHLEAMTYYSDGEYDRYENASAMANAKLGEFKRFVERTRDCCGRITIAQTDGVSTVSGSDVWRYVSAYGTALLHGYTGTEEEWLASLIGPQGPQGIQGIQGETGAGFPTGGATGTVFRKASATDYDTEWDSVDTMPTDSSAHLITSGAVKTALDGKLNTDDYITAGKKSGTTLGTKATAEGNNTTASGNFSHAEGDRSVANGPDAHAEGLETIASMVSSHAEGTQTKACGNYSHAEGYNTTACGQSQHVFGEWNIAEAEGSILGRGDYVEIVGNGEIVEDGSGAHPVYSNARTLDWDGNEVLAGKLTVGAAPTEDMDAATKKYVDDGLSGKQATLTFDTTPTQDSTNPVTSGGVRSAITSAKNSVKPYIIKTTSIAGSVFLNAKYSYEDGIPVYADHVVSLGSGKTITYRMQLTGAHKGTSVDELYFGGVIETQGTGIRTISICGITLNSREWGEFYMYPAQPLT